MGGGGNRAILFMHGLNSERGAGLVLKEMPVCECASLYFCFMR
jgi:hypothetical protein